VFLLLLQPREGSYIWKMHMVKGDEGLGIQITGGRGSKRSPRGVVIAHVEKAGAIHRYGLEATPLRAHEDQQSSVCSECGVCV